jgi:hypothetical protein
MGIEYIPSAAGMAKFHEVIHRMLDNVGEDIESDAKRLAPVGLTGKLQAGIEALPATDNHVIIKTSRNVPGDDPDVPIFVEFGTRNMAAQPFMRPATYRKRPVRGE